MKLRINESHSNSAIRDALEYMLEWCDEFRNARYIGDVAYVNLNDGMKAKAYLVTMGLAEHYRAVKVEILNNGGVIDSAIFPFKDYFKAQTLHSGDKVYPYFWEHDNKWYVEPTSKDFRNICDAISEYIGMYVSDEFIKATTYYGMDKRDYEYLEKNAGDIAVDEVDGYLVFLFELPADSDLINKYGLELYNNSYNGETGWYYDPKAVEFQRIHLR